MTLLSIQAVADVLRSHGLCVQSVSESEEPDVEDDEIVVGGSVEGEFTVQVGWGYLIANRWSEEEQAMYHGVSRSRTKAGAELVAADLKKMMNETREAV